MLFWFCSLGGFGILQYDDLVLRSNALPFILSVCRLDFFERGRRRRRREEEKINHLKQDQVVIACRNSGWYQAMKTQGMGMDSAFNGMDGGDVTDHIAKVLEITEWIKMPNVEKNELRLHVFSKSLSGDAKTWWNNEINEPRHGGTMK
ncbi:hypothetical protein Tco_0459592 [Tanacetum coccineum]